MTPLAKPLSILLTALTLVACGADDPDVLIAKGQESLKTNDVKTAEVYFKSAIEQDADNASARLELGKLYLQQREFASAEKEFRHASEVGTAADIISPLLAEALLGMREYQRVLDEVKVPEGNSRAALPLLVARANAQLGVGELEDAKITLARAQTIAPDEAAVYVSLARAALADKQIDTARARLEDAIRLDPKNLEARLLKGDLMRLLGQYAEATAAYRAALEIAPERPETRLALANIAMTERRYDDARTEIDRVLKAEPNNALAVLTDAQLALATQDFTRAQKQVSEVLRAVPNYLPALLVDGASNLALGNLGTAEASLKRFVENVPNHLYARRLYAATLLRSGQIDGAERALKGLDVEKLNDPGLHIVAAGIARARGNNDEATRHLAVAAKLSPDNAALRTELGLAKLVSGDATALSDLRQASGMEDSTTRPDAFIILKQLKDKQYDAALTSIAAFEKKAPDDPQIYNYRAAAYLGKGDLALGRKTLEAALAANPAFFPAAANLAQLDLRANNLKAAQSRFEGVLKAQPDDLRALLALGKLKLAQKDAQGFISAMNKAIAAHPQSAEPHLQLARYYALQQKLDSALSAARSALNAAPGTPQALEMLGGIQLATKDPDGAISAYKKLVEISPQKPPALTLLARAQRLTNDTVAARSSLKAAMRADSAYAPAANALVDLELSTQNTQEALRVAQSIQQTHPGNPLGFRLEGDVQRALKAPAAALAAYDRAYAISPSADVLIGQHLALDASGRATEGDARLKRWLANNPADHNVRAVYADSLIRRSQFAEAGKQYLQLNQATPNNLVFLNNLAWALFQTRDARASRYADEARKLAPENPAILDTYGWILTQSDKPKAALPSLRKAARLAPKSAEVQWHLVYALNAAGARSEAQSALDQLLASGLTLPDPAAAKALRAQLAQ